MIVAFPSSIYDIPYPLHKAVTMHNCRITVEIQEASWVERCVQNGWEAWRACLRSKMKESLACCQVSAREVRIIYHHESEYSLLRLA